MKLFDYKFLILFGLSFVVYFIYKEIEYLRCRIANIEIAILSEQVPQFNSKILNNKKEKEIVKEIYNLPIIVKSPKKINVDLTYNSEVISDSESSISSRHVAIYSNDNLDCPEELNNSDNELKSDSKTCKETQETQEIKETQAIQTTHTKDQLSKMTLYELRSIAMNRSISLVKENGKQKIKKELIDNILE